MRTTTPMMLSLLLLGSTGCNSWNRQPPPVTDPPAFRQYQVWTRDSMLLLYQVRVEHDTLHGIPIAQSRDCLACLVTIPIGSVDSMKTGGTQNVGARVMGGVAGVGVVLLIIGLILNEGTDR